MRYIVGVSSWTWMMQRHLDFRRISPGNRRRFSAHLYHWRKSISQTTAHPEHPKSIQSISVQILDLWTIYGWILNDTELGSTPRLLRKIRPTFCVGIWNHRAVPGRDHGAVLKLYRCLKHWTIFGTIINQMRNQVTNCDFENSIWWIICWSLEPVGG